jgi:hypothetical protein
VTCAPVSLVERLRVAAVQVAHPTESRS